MKTTKFLHFLIFAALVLSACTQAVTALPGSGKTPSAEMTPPAVSTDTGSGQTVTGKCIRGSDEVRLLVNSVHQYCLQYPAEYDVFHPNESEIRLFKRSVLNVSEPSVSIKVQPAGGTTVDQAVDQFLAGYTLLESEVVRASLTIDGEEAIMLDRLPGQDINRQVFVLHNDYLYQLIFLPMDKSRPELYAQSETLYNTVTQSFNFRPGTNACPDCPVSSDTIAAPTATPTAPPAAASGSINGWLWHDSCPVSGQPIAAGKDTTGCVQEGDHYRANGIKESNEAIIPYVKVKLGAGPCPSIGLAETDTLATDLSYSFVELKAGTYCISIDPLAGSNQAGAWTYPNRQGGTISTTITLGAGESKFDVNFGWDYTDLPSTQSTACTYRAAFLGDVTVPDNTIIAPGVSFVKTWRLRNDGDCAWGPGQYVHTLVFVNGDRLGASTEVPLIQNVPPGSSFDVSIAMIAPQLPGTYRGEWMLHVADGPLLGVGPDMQIPLVVQIIVGTKGTGG